MATGLQMYDALQRRVAGLPAGAPLKINRIDALDLCQLTAGDLVSRGFDEQLAEDISRDLMRTGKVETLGRHLGVRLIVERGQPDLIPGEGLRRAAGALQDDPQTMDEMFRELDAIRHPEKYAR